MELSPKQQTVELIKKSEKILLISHAKPGGDSVGSLLALKRILTEIGKEAFVVVSDPIPDSLKFLPDISEIKDKPDGSNDLVLKVNIENIDIEKIFTNTDGKTLDIILTPQNGKLEADSVTVESGKPKYDSIIVLDTPDVDKIDKIYDDFTELFFETPVVNIDHHAGNEYFGTINFVDLTATSTAEILVAIFEALGKPKPDEDTATLLLTGITADTASFKNINTTPKTLTVAAQLLAAGGRQQEIIQNLYKMKSLETLKLWGRILSNIQKDKDYRIVWSKIGYNNFSAANASIEEAKEVMDEMLANTPNADVVALFAAPEMNNIEVLLKGVKGTDVLEVAEIFGGSGQALEARFEMKNTDLGSVEAKVLAEIKKIQAKKLGRPIELSTLIPEESQESVEAIDNFEHEKPEKVEVTEEIQEPKKEINLDTRVKLTEVVEPTEVEETKVSPKSENGKDVISKAIESLEAAEETIEEKKESAEEKNAVKKIKKDPNSLTPISEILKKFNPTEKQKLTEFEKKNEEARENFKKLKED